MIESLIGLYTLVGEHPRVGCVGCFPNKFILKVCYNLPFQSIKSAVKMAWSSL